MSQTAGNNHDTDTDTALASVTEDDLRQARHPDERQGAWLLAEMQDFVVTLRRSSPEQTYARSREPDPVAAFAAMLERGNERERSARQRAAQRIAAGAESDRRRPRAVGPLAGVVAEAIDRACAAITAMTGDDEAAAGAARQDLLTVWPADDERALAAWREHARIEPGPQRAAGHRAAPHVPAPEPTVELRRHATLHPPAPDLDLLTTTVGPFGEAVCAWADPDGRARLRPGRVVAANGASFPPSRTPGPARLWISIHHPDAPDRPAQVVTVETELPYPQIQPLPDGKVLVATGRSHWRPEGGAEPNACIYDADGAPLASGCLGDGITHVQTSPDGRIWVGYNDEGIYGNFGWGHEGAPDPIGTPGIVCFDQTFHPVWAMPIGRDRAHSIDDCYTLNVAPDSVWACPFGEFPIITIRDGAATFFPTPSSDSSAELTDQVWPWAMLTDQHRRFVLIGRYRSPYHYRIGRLPEPGDGGPDEPAQLLGWGRLALEKDRDADEYGRGDQLHVFRHGQWLRTDLDQLDPR